MWPRQGSAAALFKLRHFGWDRQAEVRPSSPPRALPRGSPAGFAHGRDASGTIDAR
jgi:hypothetical protein